jgi:hypothetical protein
VRSFANWADREGYPVDAGLLKMRPLKVPRNGFRLFSSLMAISFQSPLSPLLGVSENAKKSWRRGRDLSQVNVPVSRYLLIP